MTVHDRLAALAADDRETREAESLLARCFALGRPVIITDEVVVAAQAGDAVIVAILLQPDVEPEADETEALRELAEGSAADREYIPLEIA